MRMSFRKKMFFYFSVLFFIFTISIFLFERYRENQIKIQAFEEKMEAYADMVSFSIANKKIKEQDILDTSFTHLLPSDLRITIISLQGEVLFDNFYNLEDGIENHLQRKEVVEAKKNGKSSELRYSSSLNNEYFYFVKIYQEYFIRTAMVYDFQLEKSLNADPFSFYFILVFFAVFLIFIHLATQKISLSVKKLRDFAINDKYYLENAYQFPKDELGEIGEKVIENYNLLNKSRTIINNQKEKLLQHIQLLEEGICFIDNNGLIEFYNGLFIQYLNLLSKEASSDVNNFYTDPIFEELQDFLQNRPSSYFEIKIEKHAKIFLIKAHIFKDYAAEVIINDITEIEKMQQLKKEMTSNISHELRTPLTSIRAYLETLQNENLEKEQRIYFINRAYEQTISLTDLIKDVTLLAKIDEGAQSLTIDKVNLQEILNKIKENASERLNNKQIKFTWNLPNDTLIYGNYQLLFSIFRNLLENAILYGGEKIQIHINIFKENKDYFYFSFYDTGQGIQEEKHLQKIFERFYRVNEGRSRDSGGTGLGLSIVKNAVLFHKGKIMARNRKEGGLEFIFSLRKKQNPTS